MGEPNDKVGLYISKIPQRGRMDERKEEDNVRKKAS